MYKAFIKPLLFNLNPEAAHKLSFGLLKIAQKIPFVPSLTEKLFSIKNKKLERHLFGLTFPNPVGLAAGLDKNAEAFDMLSKLGFGFVEIGTVTPKGQLGNEKPRLFRLQKNGALINRMGFNNDGVEACISKLKNRNPNLIIGGNIGKNTNTPNSDAVNDYLFVFKKLFDFVDYFVVNVSCPNITDLRELQDKTALQNILLALKNAKAEINQEKPILLKISPDLNFTQLDDVIDIVQKTKIDGIVATNTTVNRNDLSYTEDEIQKIGRGGMSGHPLKKRSTEIIRYLAEKTQGKIPIIGVGGIMNEDDAMEKIRAGASLIQIYSGFIYEGPTIIKKINKKILTDS